MVSTSNNPYGEFNRGVLQALGLAVVRFSELEEELAFGVNCLLVGKKYDEAVDITVRRLQFRGLLEAFGGLYRHRYPQDDCSELKELCKQLEDVSEERNRLVHSLWTAGKEAEKLRRYKMEMRRAGAKIWDVSVNETDILEFANHADQTCVRLVLFVGTRILQRIDDVIQKSQS